MKSPSLRIVNMSLCAFRGIPGKLKFDLSSPLTLIYAPNGTGKTSFIDAAEWILTDEIRRMNKYANRFDHEEVRCKFASPENKTEVSAVIELNDIRYDLLKTPDQWLLSNPVSRHRKENEILQVLAPHAAGDAMDKTTAPTIRKIWLRGTRFLTESDLSILVETDPDIREERRLILADLMGVRELNDRAAEFRTFVAYLKNGFDGNKGIAVIEKELAEKTQELERKTAERQTTESNGVSKKPTIDELILEKEIENLRQETASMQGRLEQLHAVAKLAQNAVEAFNDASREYCRWQREQLSDVMFSIFGRIHANETFDLVKGAAADDPFEWIAMAAGHEYIPSRDFSMGQRQDLALSVFLAKARGIGGTFFLDEPMIRLDDLNRVALLDMFRVLTVEEGSKVHLVITTASRSLLRHFQEKFINIPDKMGIPVLRVIELEGSARDGVRVYASP